MKRALLMLLVLLSTTRPAFSQRDPNDPPVIGRPDDFSGIVGKYSFAITAEPATVHVEDPITLRVRITGGGPAKYEPKRTALRILPDWERRFHVEHVPDEDRVLPAEKTWEFVYRLRPKDVSVKTIEGIKLVYYDPARRKYQEVYQEDPIAITVKAKPDLTPRIETEVAAPSSLFRLVDSQGVRAQSRIGFSPLGVSFVLIAPPLICLIALVAWRRLYPDEGHRRELRRHHAAEVVLEQIQKGTMPWRAMQSYLGERFDFAIEDPSPVDVAEFLKRRGFAKERSSQALAFFQACDRTRYSPTQVVAAELATAARELVCALEADPCAR